MFVLTSSLSSNWLCTWLYSHSSAMYWLVDFLLVDCVHDCTITVVLLHFGSLPVITLYSLSHSTSGFLWFCASWNLRRKNLLKCAFFKYKMMREKKEEKERWTTSLWQNMFLSSTMLLRAQKMGVDQRKTKVVKKKTTQLQLAVTTREKGERDQRIVSMLICYLNLMHHANPRHPFHR